MPQHRAEPLADFVALSLVVISLEESRRAKRGARKHMPRALRNWKVRVAALGILVALVGLAVTADLGSSHPTESAAKPFDVKVLVVTMFDGETGPWLQNEKLGRAFTVPAMDEPMHCGANGLCVATIG